MRQMWRKSMLWYSQDEAHKELSHLKRKETLETATEVVAVWRWCVWPNQVKAVAESLVL